MSAARFAGLLVLLAPPAAAAADDPEFNGRKASQWVAVLKEDPSARKRQAAVVVLGQLWADSRYKDALPVLGRALGTDSSPAVRLRTAAVLGGVLKDHPRNRVVADLTAALRAETDSDVRREEAIALGRFGELSKDAVAPLTAVLKDANAATRAAAADALGRIGDAAHAVGPDLVPFLKDTDKVVRQAGAFALGRIGADDPEAVGEALVALLKAEKDADIRREVVGSLGLLADRTEPSALALAAVLADPDADMRRLAARSLLSFGRDIRPAVPALVKAATADADKNVRIDALRTLGGGLGSGLKDHIDVLAGRLKDDPDFEVRIALADELGALGADGKAAVPALREAQRDPQVKVREAAVLAVRKIEKPPEKKP